MSDAVLNERLAKPMPRKTVIRRHGVMVRLTHWVNALALFFMLVSGLQIFNAHPSLYWGKASTFESPWLAIYAEGDRGITSVGKVVIDTTGVLGRSQTRGQWENRGFPSWATIPYYKSLAEGRNWHFFFAWVFGINGLIYLVSGLFSRHLQRDIVPTRRDLAHIGKDIVAHLKFQFPKGAEAARYQVLQRLAYTGVALIVLPLMVLTGLTMSPAMNAAFPFLLDVFGGRQSARSIHFICAGLTVGFIIIHLVMVILAGPFNQIRGMITGRFAIEEKVRP